MTSRTSRIVVVERIDRQGIMECGGGGGRLERYPQKMRLLWRRKVQGLVVDRCEIGFTAGDATTNGVEQRLAYDVLHVRG